MGSLDSSCCIPVSMCFACFFTIHCKVFELTLVVAGMIPIVHKSKCFDVLYLLPSSALWFMLAPPFRAFGLNAFNLNSTSNRAPFSQCLGHRRSFPRVALMLEWCVFLQNPLHWCGGNPGEAWDYRLHGSKTTSFKEAWNFWGIAAMVHGVAVFSMSFVLWE